MQAIAKAAIEVERAVVQDMAVVKTDNSDKMQNVVLKISGAIMQQPTFNWKQRINISNSKLHM